MARASWDVDGAEALEWLVDGTSVSAATLHSPENSRKGSFSDPHGSAGRVNSLAAFPVGTKLLTSSATAWSPHSSLLTPHSLSPHSLSSCLPVFLSSCLPLPHSKLLFPPTLPVGGGNLRKPEVLADWGLARRLTFPLFGAIFALRGGSIFIDLLIETPAEPL